MRWNISLNSTCYIHKILHVMMESALMKLEVGIEWLNTQMRHWPLGPPFLNWAKVTLFQWGLFLSPPVIILYYLYNIVSKAYICMNRWGGGGVVNTAPSHQMALMTLSRLSRLSSIVMDSVYKSEAIITAALRNLLFVILNFFLITKIRNKC